MERTEKWRRNGTEVNRKVKMNRWLGRGMDGKDVFLRFGPSCIVILHKLYY